MLDAQGWDEDAFRLAAESLPKAVWTHDASGGIDFVNRRFKDYFEFGLPGVTDMMNWSSVVHPRDFDRMMRTLSVCISNGVPLDEEIRFKPLSAGETAYRNHHLRIMPVAYDHARRVSKWVGSASDVQGAGDQGAKATTRDSVIDICLDAHDAGGAHRALDLVMGFIRSRAGTNADYPTIRLVFFELLGNVVKHAPGRLMMRVDWFEEGPYLHVFDRGKGFEYKPVLPADMLAEGGRGLYLISCLAGAVAVHRLPGCGAYVSVRLPAQGARPAV
jgi:anti-sigma regulatory factor (Ser/Thr protein kinase)